MGKPYSYHHQTNSHLDIQSKSHLPEMYLSSGRKKPTKHYSSRNEMHLRDNEWINVNPDDRNRHATNETYHQVVDSRRRSEVKFAVDHETYHTRNRSSERAYVRSRSAEMDYNRNYNEHKERMRYHESRPEEIEKDYNNQRNYSPQRQLSRQQSQKYSYENSEKLKKYVDINESHSIDRMQRQRNYLLPEVEYTHDSLQENYIPGRNGYSSNEKGRRLRRDSQTMNFPSSRRGHEVGYQQRHLEFQYRRDGSRSHPIGNERDFMVANSSDNRHYQDHPQTQQFKSHRTIPEQTPIIKPVAQRQPLDNFKSQSCSGLDDRDIYREMVLEGRMFNRFGNSDSRRRSSAPEKTSHDDKKDFIKGKPIGLSLCEALCVWKRNSLMKKSKSAPTISNSNNPSDVKNIVGQPGGKYEEMSEVENAMLSHVHACFAELDRSRQS